MRNIKLWRGLSTIFTSLLTILLSVSILASSFEIEINSMLGTTSSKMVNLDAGEVGSTDYFTSDYASIEEMLGAKGALAQMATDEGVVLVKNNGALPLTYEKNVTCLGSASVDLVYAGASGAGIIGNVDTGINITLKKGLEAAGFAVNPTIWQHYETNSNKRQSGDPRGYTGGDFTTGEMDVTGYPADRGYADYGEACIVVLSRNAGESNDAPTEAYVDGTAYYQLNGKEFAVLEEAKANFEKVIVIVNSPSALSIDELKKDDGIDAILQAGGLGMNGAYSLGNILRGTVNPSGRLVDTYAVNSLSSPAMQNWGNYQFTNAETLAASTENGPMENNTKYLVQAEGIYIGYKYYETRYEDCVLNQGSAATETGAFASNGNWKYDEEVSYSFGHGLSYTTFTQAIESFQVKNDVIEMKVKVTNTGAVPGKEVVQLYAQSPYTEYDRANKVEKSSVQLVNFEKTGLLGPGESETLTIKMDLYNICSYDYTKAKTWILDDGTYYFAVGNDAHTALNNMLAAKGKGVANGMSAPGDPNMARSWENPQFRLFDQPEFTEDGFTTAAGSYHNNTETKITNQLESGDLNYWTPNAVTYLTRSDWTGTWPVSHDTLTADENMTRHLNGLVYEPGDSDTSGIVTGADTNYQISMMIGLPYEDENWDLILNQLTLDNMMSLVGKNFSATDPLPGIGYPGTVDNDGPAGPVANYLPEHNTGSTPYDGIRNYSDINPRMYPSHTVLASTFNQKLVYEAGKMFGEDALYAGQTGIWAPGLNLHRSPYSGRNFEYFSEDSMLTYILGAQMVSGMQEKGAVATPKHFAFNDFETNRFGIAAFMDEQTARENGLRGFEGALSVAKARCTMTGLNRVGCDWIGMHTGMQNNVLRDEWGFDGYVITDNAYMPFMYGYSVAFGTDKFLVFQPGRYEVQLAPDVTSKDLRLLEALREACHRILFANVNSSAMNGISANVEIVKITPWWKTAMIAVDAGVGVLSIGCIALFVLASKKRKEEV